MSLGELYKKHFEELHRYAFNILLDTYLAEDIVQECFINFFLQLDKDVKILNPRAYLFKMVYNLSIVQKKKIPQTLPTGAVLAGKIKDGRKNKLESMISGEVRQEQLEALDQLLTQMPEQCRLVFTKSKMERKKYKEIAQELSISEKTVEAHMSKAFKIIKEFVRVNRFSFALILSILTDGGNTL